MIALLIRDLRLAIRAGGGFGLGLAFFLLVAVIVPLGVAPKSSVTFSLAPKSSLSTNEMPVIAFTVLSSLTVSVVGAIRTGASFVAEMLMLKVAVRLLLPLTPTPSTPLPFPLPPTRSSTVVVMTTVPFRSALAGV